MRKMQPIRKTIHLKEKNCPVLKYLICLLFCGLPFQLKAQKIEEIYVHLYTDSLKKNTYNYINIDGKLSDGRYLPLDTTHILFKSSDGRFKGNDLFIPAGFNKKYVTIYAFLKEDTSRYKKFRVYIKQAEDPPLKSEEEILREMKRRRS